MTVDRGLIERFRGLAETLVPDVVLEQERAVRGAIGHDGAVRPDAIVTALPWQRADVMLPGAVITSPPDVAVPFPQGADARHIALSARVAPSSGPLTLRFAAASASETVSLQPGEASVMAGVRIAVPPGGWMAASVQSAGGAEDVSISIHYTVGGSA